MSDPELERKLAQLPLPHPSRNLRERVIARARRQATWRRCESGWRWALLVAALLLIVANTHFAQVEQQQMIALVGPQGPHQPVDVQALMAQIARRQRVLVMLVTTYDGSLKEDVL